MSLTRGRAAEDAALDFLRGRGLVLVARNHRCRGGELDLVMRDGSSLVFIEVRARSERGFGSAEATVTARKQRRVITAARHFLALHPAEAKRPMRFDVVAISLDGGDNALRWIRAAFDAA